MSYIRLRLWLGCDNINSIIIYSLILRFFISIFFWGGGARLLLFFLFHISSSWVKIRLHTKNELLMLSGSALKVELGGVAQDMWWMLRRICGGVVKLITFSTLTTVELH